MSHYDPEDLPVHWAELEAPRPIRGAARQELIERWDGDDNEWEWDE